MLQTIAINNTLAAINDNIAQGFAAHDMGDEEEKLAHARAAFLLIGEIREIADCSQGALDLQTFFDAVAAYENATRALLELLLAWLAKLPALQFGAGFSKNFEKSILTKEKGAIK